MADQEGGGVVSVTTEKGKQVEKDKACVANNRRDRGGKRKQGWGGGRGNTGFRNFGKSKRGRGHVCRTKTKR